MTNQALAVRLLPFGMLLLIGMQTAQAIECSGEMPSNRQGHWSYRLIDGRKCWYPGQNNPSKSLLKWPVDTSAPSTPANALALTAYISPAPKANTQTVAEQPNHHSDGTAS